jgi:sterol desaturase/sphingolipid hydroxylase (fatty acid hydroxylase superfamily)
MGIRFDRALESWVKLSKREYYADFFITPPLTALMLIISAWHGLSAAWFLSILVGIVAWTLYEYVTHRWMLHRFWLLRYVHELHHARQRDYIALHPLATLAIYAAMWYLFGMQSSALMVGFSIGYVVYSAMHTLFHFGSISERHPLFRLKRHHAIHHRFEDTNFGVSSSFWDSLFGTYSS